MRSLSKWCHHRILIAILSLIAIAWLPQSEAPGVGAPVGSPWPMFGQGPRHDGRGAGPGAAGTKLWAFDAGSAIASSPVVAADGAIYVNAEPAPVPAGVPQTYSSRVFAVRPDGVGEWAFQIPEGTGGQAQWDPAVGSDGSVYVSGADGVLYAVNPDGRLRWSLKIEGAGSSPTIGPGGTVYLCNDKGDLYAVNPDGTKRWSHSVEAAGTWEVAGAGRQSCGVPAIAPDGTLYVGGSGLHAINPNGTARWTFDPGCKSISSPAIGADATLYACGSGDAHGGAAGEVYAVNPDGKKRWEFNTGEPVGAPAIAADGTIYVGSIENYWSAPGGGYGVGGYGGDGGGIPYYGGYGGGYSGCLYALRPDGTKKWGFNIGNVMSAPAVAGDGTVYVGSNDCHLYAINPDGTFKWSYRMGDEVSAPAIGARGTVYVGSKDGKLYAIK